ncbi:MAG: FAD-dependent oxidoreductase [Firmicutes bacterium]|nr:FAD-dependent oxidoreductase [Bacillota bacterium]
MKEQKHENLYDIVIIGGGPAGLSAALYSGRAKLRTLVLEKGEIGGQIKITSEVVNYPGIAMINGKELVSIMKQQAVSFGVEFQTAEVSKVDLKSDIKIITTPNKQYRALSVIVATGAIPRKLGFEGEQEFAGRGIAYCATCDGEFFTGKDVFVIGAGFAAAEEAIFLTRFAKNVTVIAREPEFTCSKTIADKVLAHPQITVKFNSEIQYVKGNAVIKEAKFINNITGETWEHHASESDNTFGVFIFVGYEPLSQIFSSQITLDQWGYIPTDENMLTNITGVYAVGDIRPKRLRQLVTATSDGAIAATSCEKYVEDKKHDLGIVIKHELAEQKHLTVHLSRDSSTKNLAIIPRLEQSSTTQPEFHLNTTHDNVFDENTVEQIEYVLSRMTNPVSLSAILKPDCKLSDEIKLFLEQLVFATKNIQVNIFNIGENKELEKFLINTPLPTIALVGKDNNLTGVSFSAVPVGHELESFILAIYNASGDGQAIDDALVTRIKNIKAKIDLKIGVSLSCTMCPELVQGCMRIALLNPNITSTMIDLAHFPDLRNKFNVMSVPALIINDKDIIFGRKSINEIISLIENFDEVTK